MSENYSSKVWIWKDPEKRWINKVLDHIKLSSSSDNDITILHCEDVEDFDTSIPLTNYLFNLCMLYNIFESERAMFINLKDVISSLELCLEREKNANKASKTEISDQEIIDFYDAYVSCFNSEGESCGNKYVMLLKEFLKENNCIDAWQLLNKCLSFKTHNDIPNYVTNSRYLVLGLPRSPIAKKLIGVLCGNEVNSIYVETPLDASLQGSPSFHVLQKIKITCESLKVEEIPINTEKELKFGSATEEYVEDIILAFLSLLVNSRNELALSKAMISPIIDLSHGAFTALKHLSVEKDMPMCQVAISYVTRVRLGGKSYAPSDDCPMLPHLKGLELFVDTLNQMQTIIEEDSQPRSAIKRLINMLKKKLLKCGNEKLKNSSIEIVTEKLQATHLKVSDVMKSRISSTNSQICQEALDNLYYFVNFVNCNNFIYDPKMIIAKREAKRTPLNLPPLLGYFRSPEEESSCDTKSSLNDDNTLSSSLVQYPAFSSYFHHSESSDISSSCINSSTPSRVTFRGFLKEKNENNRNENIKLPKTTSKNSVDVMKNKRNPKRSILGEITNENDSLVSSYSNGNNCAKKSCKVFEKNAKENLSELNNKKSKKEVKKAAKKFKQIPGQEDSVM